MSKIISQSEFEELYDKSINAHSMYLFAVKCGTASIIVNAEKTFTEARQAVIQAWVDEGD